MTTLRLADAILLGDSLKARDAWRFLSDDESCGCALGGAFLAIGGKSVNSVVKGIQSAWPWMTFDHRATYWNGCNIMGQPVEAIAAYADSVDPTPRCEPPVQEPSPVETRQESTVSHD